MPDIFSSGPGYVVYDLVLSGARSAQLSADESKVLLAMGNGDILVYDLDTRTLLQTIDVAAELGAMTLSDDGTKAWVIGKASAGGAAAIYQVNLATGVSTVLPLSGTIVPADIEYIAGNKLLISAGQTYVYNLATQTAATPTGTNPVGFFGHSVMVETDGLVLIGETDTSSGPLELYDETTGLVIGAGDSYQGGSPSGFNSGAQAVTREGGLVAQFIYFEHIEIYNLSLQRVTSLANFGSYGGGLAFDADGEFLLAYRSGTLAAFDTDTWTSALIVDVRPASSFHTNGGSGDTITTTSDNAFIILNDAQDGFVQIIELTAPLGSSGGVVGSSAADNLSAVLGQNVDGLGGIDSLSISFRAATTAVTADFRGLQSSTTVTIAGATITNIENIVLIEGSDHADILAPFHVSPNGGATVNGYAGDDQIFISTAVGSFGPTVDGGAGNDLIDGRGVSQSSFFTGGEGDDTIYTASGNNSTAGGANGNDTLHSWGIADGGAGNDTIFLYNPTNVSGASPTGYGGDGNDSISVGQAIAPGTSVSFVLAGEGGADTLVGSAVNDYLTSVGMSGNQLSPEDTGAEQDSLSGGDGQDHFNAGYGDSVDGGAGDDVLILSLAAATGPVTLNTSDFIGATPVNVGGGLIRNVEYIDELYATNFNDTITVGGAAVRPQGFAQVHGRDGNDTFYNQVANTYLYGDGGNDLYIVSAGAIFANFYGGTGVDTVDYTAFGSAVTVTLSNGAFDIVGSGTGSSGAVSTVLYEVENATGTALADQITGSREANILSGLGGNDVLAGLLGADQLSGGGGDDQLDGGADNDTLTGGDGADQLTGGEHNDTLTGGAGNDTFLFSAREFGQDTITDFAAGDRIDLSALGIPDYATLQAFITQVGADTRIEFFYRSTVERITIQNVAPAALSAASFIFNTSAAARDPAATGLNDVLFGATGNDTLGGAGGNDRLIAGSGDDLLLGGTGTDTLTGGSGADTFRGTIAEHGGDTIADFTRGDRVHITDATHSGFTFSQSGNSVTFGSSTLTLSNSSSLYLVAHSAGDGGVEIEVGTMRSDTSGDGVSDILWRNTSGGLTYWRGTGSNGFDNATGFFATVGTDWQIAANADITGDGRADILWRNANGTVTFWSAEGSGFASSAFLSGVGLDWTIAGSGDFSGDGKADILWRNSAGALTYWESTGTGFDNNTGYFTNVATDWQVADTGDYNGDGRADILWRNSNGALTAWTASGDGFANAFPVVGVGLDWSVAGSGDFDGDGADDIIWRNSNGALTVWLGDTGSFTGTFPVNHAGSDWDIADTGDYNGDGRSDILWRHSSGAMAVWNSTGSGFDASSYGNAVGTDWEIFGG